MNTNIDRYKPVKYLVFTTNALRNNEGDGTLNYYDRYITSYPIKNNSPSPFHKQSHTSNCVAATRARSFELCLFKRQCYFGRRSFTLNNAAWRLMFCGRAYALEYNLSNRKGE